MTVPIEWPDLYLFWGSGVSKKPTLGLLVESICQNRPKMALLGISKDLIKIKDTKAWLVLSEKMDVSYPLVDWQK